jgi:large subunit ribosomal protein L3
MTLKLMGKKRGMVRLFDEKGNVVVGTVIEVEPNVVTQVKTKESDGYNAIQLGFEVIKVKDSRTIDNRVTKPLNGHFKKAGVTPRRHLSEARMENSKDYTVGQEIGVTEFAEIPYIDVTAMSKGKGYQGVIKLHNFAGGPAAHGSGFHRHAGSTGMRSSPGRCFKGGPRPSHMGYDTVTVQNLKVVKVDAQENIIVVQGSVPGPANGLVYFAEAVKLVTAKKNKK